MKSISAKPLARALLACPIVILAVGLATAGCSTVEQMKDGRVTATPMPDGTIDIYSSGGIFTDRSIILQKWNAAAMDACKGPYTMVGERKTLVGGVMSIEGRILCTKTR